MMRNRIAKRNMVRVSFKKIGFGWRSANRTRDCPLRAPRTASVLAGKPLRGGSRRVVFLGAAVADSLPHLQTMDRNLGGGLEAQNHGTTFDAEHRDFEDGL